MIQKIFFLFSLIFLISCGYTPIHNIEKNKNINIERIEFINGDRNINIRLRQNLRQFELNKTSDNSFSLTIKSSYEKQVISKNSAVVATKYILKSEVSFEIQHKNKIDNVNFVETFVMDKLDDDFENRKYEDTIKQNFANSIFQKLLNKLSSI